MVTGGLLRCSNAETELVGGRVKVYCARLAVSGLIRTSLLSVMFLCTSWVFGRTDTDACARTGRGVTLPLDRFRPRGLE